jgi:hypothetical protein
MAARLALDADWGCGMIFTATDGFVPAAGVDREIIRSMRSLRQLGDLHNEAERLRNEIGRANWAFAPQAEFDKLVSDIVRWNLKVRGSR